MGPMSQLKHMAQRFGMCGHVWLQGSNEPTMVGWSLKARAQIAGGQGSPDATGVTMLTISGGYSQCGGFHVNYQLCNFGADSGRTMAPSLQTQSPRPFKDGVIYQERGGHPVFQKSRRLQESGSFMV